MASFGYAHQNILGLVFFVCFVVVVAFGQKPNQRPTTDRIVVAVVMRKHQENCPFTRDDHTK